jgi:Mn2+/Fe2+ NRAMP family transporter
VANSESVTKVSILAPATVIPASRLRHLLRVLGPAWIVMLADVDAASVVTAAQAGSSFGYAMLLPLVLLIPVLYLVQEMTARLAICTGLGHAELIRERFGTRWGWVAVGSMAAVDMLAYVAEFAGIVLGGSLVGISAPVAVGGTLVLHAAMVLTGSYARFERMALVLSLGLFAFVALALVAHPDPQAVLGGLSPAQPFGQAGYLDLVVATVGAVIMPWMLFYQQAATVDKGLGLDDLRAARWETLIGAIASELLMGAIVIAAAAAANGPARTVLAGGMALPSGLAALASSGGGVLIAVGMIGAGLLAAIVISLSSAWAWGELLRWPHSLNLSIRKAPAFYGLYFVEIVPAAGIALLATNLVSVVIGAMVLNVVVLAIPLAFLIRLSGDQGLLGELANSARRTALLWGLTGILLALGLWSTVSLLRGGL